MRGHMSNCQKVESLAVRGHTQKRGALYPLIAYEDVQAHARRAKAQHQTAVARVVPA